MISHLLKCTLVVEPFCVATMRQLSSSHPIYKLLKPHFRYFYQVEQLSHCSRFHVLPEVNLKYIFHNLFYSRYMLPTASLLRKHLCERSAGMDKWTSLGADGYRALIKAYFKQFTLDELDLPLDLARRGVDRAESLPGYLYRDDGLKLWNALAKFCFKIITHLYKTDDDVKEDTELGAWIAVGVTSCDVNMTSMQRIECHCRPIYLQLSYDYQSFLLKICSYCRISDGMASQLTCATSLHCQRNCRVSVNSQTS